MQPDSASLYAQQENLLRQLAEGGIDLTAYDPEIKQRRALARAALLRAFAAQQAGPEFADMTKTFARQYDQNAQPLQTKVGREINGRFEIDPAYAEAVRRGNLELLAKVAGSRADRTAAAEQRAAENEATRAARAQQAEADRALRREIAAMNAANAAALREDRAADRRQREIDSGVARLTKEIDDKGLAELEQSVSNLERSIAQYQGKPLPGFGRVEGALPDAVVNDEARQLRQDYAAVRNALLKARSGGAVTEGEANRLLQELGEGFGRPDDLVRRGVSNLRRVIDARKSNLAAGASDDVIREYEARGGIPLLHYRQRSTSDAASNTSKKPAVGDIQEDTSTGRRYRYKGGDPADSRNWEPLR
jgi:hypothetical protein